MSCQLAMPLASHAADTLLARLDGTKPKDLNPASVGQCISVGRHGGTIQMSHFNDEALPMHLGGHLAATIKESVQGHGVVPGQGGPQTGQLLLAQRW